MSAKIENPSAPTTPAPGFISFDVQNYLLYSRLYKQLISA